MTKIDDLIKRMSNLIAQTLPSDTRDYLIKVTAVELAAAEICYLNILEADNEMLRVQIRALTEELESLDNCEMHPLC
jgi:hypothetical protein